MLEARKYYNQGHLGNNYSKLWVQIGDMAVGTGGNRDQRGVKLHITSARGLSPTVVLNAVQVDNLIALLQEHRAEMVAQPVNRLWEDGG